MSSISRSHAKLEVKRRGGIISEISTEFLNYLIMGNTPSPSWKYNCYGNKVVEAYRFKKAGRSIFIISEDKFMQALDNYKPETKNPITEKILVIVFEFDVQLPESSNPYHSNEINKINNNPNINNLEKYKIFKQFIDKLKNENQVFIDHNSYSDTFSYTVEYTYRFLKLFKKDDIAGSTRLINQLNKMISETGIKGIFKYYERQEGAAFKKLKECLPEKYQQLKELSPFSMPPASAPNC